MVIAPKETSKSTNTITTSNKRTTPAGMNYDDNAAIGSISYDLEFGFAYEVKSAGNNYHREAA